jgi:mono/diheme cytochrome c family protein
VSNKTIRVAALVAAVGALAPALSRAADAAQLERGKAAFTYWCATCHGAGTFENGRTLAGTTSLGVKYKGTNISPVLEERTDLLPDYVKAVIRNGIKGMPTFRKTEISASDADAIGAYIARNFRN